MAGRWRSRWQAQWKRLTFRHKLPVALCVLATVFSLALTSCDDRSPPTASGAATPALPFGCVSHGDAAPAPPHYIVATTTPLAADGAVYVGYSLPAALQTIGNPAQDPQGQNDQYAIAALRARDGALLWRVPASKGARPLAVADGVLVVLSSELIGLRARDGITLWRAPLASSLATHSGGVLYVTTDADVDAVRLLDGRVLWQARVKGGPVLTAPVVDGHAVYIASGNGSVVALRKDTGALLWTSFPGPFPSDQVWYIPLAVAAGYLYARTSGLIVGSTQVIPGGVVGLNPIDGTSEGYALRLPPYTEVPYPTLVGGLYAGVLLPGIPPGATPPEPLPTILAYRLLGRDSQLLWRVPVQANAFAVSSITRDAQALYLAAAPQGMIWAFRLADGTVLWRQRALATLSTGIVVDSGRLFETTPSEVDPCRPSSVHQPFVIRALSSEDGSIAWIRTLGSTL